MSLSTRHSVNDSLCQSDYILRVGNWGGSPGEKQTSLFCILRLSDDEPTMIESISLDKQGF
jgi:hypothetical protein